MWFYRWFLAANLWSDRRSPPHSSTESISGFEWGRTFPPLSTPRSGNPMEKSMTTQWRTVVTYFRVSFLGRWHVWPRRVEGPWSTCPREAAKFQREYPLSRFPTREL